MGFFINWYRASEAVQEIESGKRKARRSRKAEPRHEPKPLPLPDEQELVQRIIQLPMHRRIERLPVSRPFDPKEHRHG